MRLDQAILSHQLQAVKAVKVGTMQKTLQAPPTSGPAVAGKKGKGKVKAEQPGAMVTAQPGKSNGKGIDYGTGRPGTKAEAAKKWLEHSDLANNSSGPAQQAHDKAATHYDKAHAAYSQGNTEKGDRHMFKGDRFAYLGQSITPSDSGKSKSNGSRSKPGQNKSRGFMGSIDITAATEHKRMARHLVTLHNGDKVEAKRHASTAARSAKRMGDSRLQGYWNSVNKHIKASIDQEVQEILGGGPGSGRHPGSGVGALEDELKPKPEAEPAKSTSLTHPADEIIGYLTAHGFAADTGHGANGDIRKGSVIYKREFSSGGDPGSGSYRSHEVHTVMVHSDGSWEHESESNHEGKGLAGVHSIHSIHAVGTNTDLDHLKKSIEVLEAREFSQDKREKMAKKGTAMKHGGFPIANKEDLSNAKQAIGRAKNRAATIAHINKRAKALGAPGFGKDAKAESYKTDVAGPSLTGKPPSLKGEAMLTDGFSGNLSQTLQAMETVSTTMVEIQSGGPGSGRKPGSGSGIQHAGLHKVLTKDSFFKHQGGGKYTSDDDNAKHTVTTKSNGNWTHSYNYGGKGAGQKGTDRGNGTKSLFNNLDDKHDLVKESKTHIIPY